MSVCMCVFVKEKKRGKNLMINEREEKRDRREEEDEKLASHDA